MNTSLHRALPFRTGFAALALGIVTAWLCPASAQQLDSLMMKQLAAEGLSLEDIANLQVVSVTRTAQRSSDAPATVRIVTSDQIKLRGYQSLAEVLQDLPDVKVEQNSDPRWQNDTQIRGVFGMDKFIILLDGVKISSPTNDLIPIMENYPVNFARQIEVVYGPASAVYGADALAGVINIVTKKPEDLGGATVQGSVLGGMYSTFTGNFIAARKVSDLVSFTVSGQYFYDKQPLLDAVKNFRKDGKGIDDFLSSGTFPTDLGFPQTPATPVSTTIANPLSAYALYASLGVGDFKFNLFRNYSRNPSSTANKPNNSLYNEGAYFGHAVTMLNGTYSTFLTANLNSTSFLTYSLYDLDNTSNFRNAFTGIEPAYLFSVGRMFKAEQLVSYTASSDLTVTGGITYENYFSIPRGHDLLNVVSGIDNPGSPIVNSVGLPGYASGIEARIFKVNYNNVGAFVQAQYTPVDNLILTGGVRVDRDSRFPATVNPRLGIVYRPAPKVTAKALYGSAFLAPSPLSAYDEFGTFFDAGGTATSAFMRLSNPDLGPQKIQTFELSLRTLLTEEFSVTATGYYNLLSGLFSQVSDAATLNLYNGQYPNAPGAPVGYIEIIVNQGNQRNYGGTLQLDYVKRLGGDNRLSLYAALSLIDGRVEVLLNPALDNGALTEAQIGGVSPVMFRIGGDLVLDKVSISPRLIVAGEQRAHPQQASGFKLAPNANFNPSTPPSPVNPPNINTTERSTLAGYALANLTVRYQVLETAALFVRVQNLLNADYRNVNLGAGIPEGGGSAQVEFPEGAPQNPVRITGGVRVVF